MAQTSIGFNGSISAVQWAQNAALLLSSGSSIGSASDCRVTQVAGSRAVAVAAGRIGADGVVTTLDAAETVTLPTPTNGQWYLLVLNRSWASGATSLALRNGPTTATASSGTVPGSYPASTNTTPGTNADVALAWLWANSSGTAVTIVPIIRPHATIVPRRGTAAQRDALFAATGTFAARKYLQDTAGQWFNTDTSNFESYSAEYDATLNPSGRRGSAGWYAFTDDTGWVDPSFVNGGNNGGGPAAQFRRKNGVVMMTGQWVPTTTPEIQFRLPAGCRPKNTMTFWCERGSGNGPAAKMEVQVGTGAVIYRGGPSGGTGAIDYSGIQFIADA